MKTIKMHWILIIALTLAVSLAGVAALGYSSQAASSNEQPVGVTRAAAMPALPEATCTLEGSLRTCELWALPGSLTMPDGRIVPVWGFADNAAGPASVPGPTIRAKLGETLQIVLHNEIFDQEVAVGLPSQDGLSDLVGGPTGSSVAYTFDLVKAGTFLYEAGLTSDGPRQVAMGLAGALIVAGEPQLVDEEVVLIFNEIDPAFNANPTGFLLIDFRAKYWLINGHPYPDTGTIDVAAGSKVLVRYLNAGSEHYSIGLLGLDQTVIAADSDLLSFPRGVVFEAIAPGQTREVLVTVPEVADGTLFPLFNGNMVQHNNNQRLADKRMAFGGMLTFLRVTSTTGPGGQGPVVSNVFLTPQKSNGTTPVILTATLTDDDVEVVAYEFFVDTLGTPGLAEIAVPIPAMSVTLEVELSVAQLEALSGGEHTLYIRGKDASGNWGQVGSAVLTLDKAGPHILGLGLGPNPTNGTVDVVLSGTADDRLNGNSNIIAAEYRLDGGAWQPMSFSPLDSPFAGLSATIPAARLAALPEGQHTVEVRAQDVLENWSLTYGTTNLNLDKTGPTSNNVALSITTIDLSKPLPTSVRLTATVADPLSGGIQSTVSTAEGFIGVVGLPGTGFALYPTDGLFNSASESIYYNIPGSFFSTLPAGVHNVWVLGKDQAGNWGPGAFATINIITKVVDTAGPAVANVVATPNPTAGAANVILTATATDNLTNVAGAVWFLGPTPTKKLNTMTAVDGIYDELTEDLTATINVRTWKTGTYEISVRAYDAAGNWGNIITISLVVTK